ncbi:hypothetical protein BJV78DRAFT_792864 [Lactifluus subvellereus]|nr:hypothetical protein BJV78DRAFT_792864 [Lactifluus subvellereus]
MCHESHVTCHLAHRNWQPTMWHTSSSGGRPAAAAVPAFRQNSTIHAKPEPNLQSSSSSPATTPHTVPISLFQYLLLQLCLCEYLCLVSVAKLTATGDVASVPAPLAAHACIPSDAQVEVKYTASLRVTVLHDMPLVLVRQRQCRQKDQPKR